MRKLVCFLALLPLLSFAPQGRGTSGWTQGKVQYKIQYIRGSLRAKMATATLTMSDTEWKGDTAYAAGFSVQAANVFKLFLRSEYKVDLVLSKEDLSPYYYSFPHVKKGKKHQLEFIYGDNEVESVLQIENTPEPVRKLYPKNGLLTLDVASFSLYVRSLDPASLQGEPMAVQLLFGSSAELAHLNYVGEDSAFREGENCFHYILEIVGRGLLENKSGKEIHLWVSPGAERTLCGLEIKLEKGSIVAKMLEKNNEH